MNRPNFFHKNCYQLLPPVIPGRIVESLLDHALRMARQPELAAGDKQVPRTAPVYADPRGAAPPARLVCL